MIRALCIAALAACSAAAQGLEFIKANYTKYEFQIPMRDGKRLFTSVYVPKELLPEVRSWLAEHQRLKHLLHEIHQLSVALLRARARLRKLKAGRP